jgi:ribonuclease HI
MYCDGAYCDDGAASSAILMSPSGIKVRYAVTLDFEGKTNNVAEYEGLLLGIRKARAIGAQIVKNKHRFRTHYKANRQDL